MDQDGKRWTVQDHLVGAPDENVRLYRSVEAYLLGLDGVIQSVSRTTITFRGRRRGFAGARPVRQGVRGYLDLMRPLPADARIRRVAPYTKKLFVHQYVLTSESDFDDIFRGWLHEAWRVGEGDHLRA